MNVIFTICPCCGSDLQFLVTTENLIHDIPNKSDFVKIRNQVCNCNFTSDVMKELVEDVWQLAIDEAVVKFRIATMYPK